MRHPSVYWRVRFQLAAGTPLGAIPVDQLAALQDAGYDLADMASLYEQ